MQSVFIHIGTRKSGTTSLQAALRASQEPLAAAGFALPLIIHDGSDRRLRHLKDIDAEGAREKVDKVLRSRLRGVDADNVLISNEVLAELPQSGVDYFLARVREHLDGARIVVIVTARPWSKVLGSEWQERVKGRAKLTFADNLALIQAGSDPVFESRHDLVGIAERWGSTIPADDVRVIAVPSPSYDGPGVIELYCGIVGLDPSVLVAPSVESNQSLNPAQAELMRRVNIALGDSQLRGKAEYRSAIRHWLLPTGFVEGRGNRIQLAGADADWCASQERRQVDRLLELGCQVVGDRANLTPPPSTEPQADEPTDAEVAATAVQVLAALAASHPKQMRQRSSRASNGRLPANVRSIPMSNAPASDVPPTAAAPGAAGAADAADPGAPDVLDCKIARNQYGAYCIPSASANRPAARAVLRGDVYEPKTIEFIRAHCGDQDVIHAGTYFGDFLPGVSSGLGEGALLWAFEPNSESHRCAEITVLLNQLANVRLHHAGLGATGGKSQVQIANEKGQALGGASRIVDDTAAGTTTEPVSLLAIDDAVPVDRQVGILQLDVEGFEQHALSGAFETIKRCRPVIVLEQGKWNEFLDSAWFADHVLALGYAETERFHLNRVYRPI